MSVTQRSRLLRLVHSGSVLIFVLFVLNGCSHVGCGTAEAYEPFVQLIYPKPNAQNVSLKTSVLVFSASGSAPITLVVASAAPIRLAPATVPSPIPSPAASPVDSGAIDMAVVLPPLTAGTTYSVVAGENIDSCGASQPASVKIGSFTTE